MPGNALNLFLLLLLFQNIQIEKQIEKEGLSAWQCFKSLSVTLTQTESFDGESGYKFTRTQITSLSSPFFQVRGQTVRL